MKREREDEEEVSSLTCASPEKTVQGVVLNIFNMKKGKSGIHFFDRRLGEDNGKLRFVWYDSKIRHHLVECKGKEGAVIMSYCKVKAGRCKSDGLEVRIQNSSQITLSEKCDVSKELERKQAIIPINQIREMLLYQHVTVEGKVVKLEEAKEVLGGKKDMVMADTSENICLTIWEIIGHAVEGKSYRFLGMMVQVFQGQKFIINK